MSKADVVGMCMRCGCRHDSNDEHTCHDENIPDVGQHMDPNDLRSPDGSLWRPTVNDSGVVTYTKVAE